MKALVKIFPTIMFFLLCNCKSPSDKALDDFKKTDESMDNTNKAIDSSGIRLRTVTVINKKTADSISLIFRNTTAFLAALKVQLDKNDPTGERLDIAEKLLVITPKGDSLFHYMVSVYNLENEYSPDYYHPKENFMEMTASYKSEWLTKHFKRTPTVAAQTILSSFQNKCALIDKAIWESINYNN